MTGASRTGPVIVASTVPLLAATAIKANITMTEDGLPFTNFTPDLDMPQVLLLNIDDGAGAPALLKANAVYTVTLSRAMTDTYDQPAPAAKVFTFTTGAN
jgi:hypothetical protein